MMNNWWVHQQYYEGGISLVVGWAFWVILSITLHELAHGWAALRQGDTTPRDTGHMTWDPLVHMGGMSLIMFALIGIAWGMMPTDPSRYRSGRKGRAIVAFAGPAMNLLLAFGALTTLGIMLACGAQNSESDAVGRLIEFFFLGGVLNLVLFGLNLLPVPPLDGSQILMGLSQKFYIWFHNPVFRQYAFFAVLALFFITPLGSVAFRSAQYVSLLYLLLFPDGSAEAVGS